MNVSKHEQRVLHVLAQGGRIEYERDERGRITEILCVTREGWALSDCTEALFHKLRRRGLIASQDSRPYRITREGLAAVRAQLDNR
ncbi:MAG TPA: YjhX family toxin [Azospirillaceae bacterium]|nr:YjhX family toxin [Azospirillaceae bacterium]